MHPPDSPIAPIRRSRSIHSPARLLAAFCLASLALRASAVALPDQDIVVQIKRNGAEIVVDVDCPVRAPHALVWEVMTDYDNMAKYISNLQLSGVQTRVDNLLTVRQAGKSGHGPFSITFDNLREIELFPPIEIRSHLISGDLKASSFTTRIVDGGDGVVHIINHGHYTPNFWVPPLIGPAVLEGETRIQYGEFRSEILRREKNRVANLSSP